VDQHCRIDAHPRLKRGFFRLGDFLTILSYSNEYKDLQGKRR
jgi:hypothetical protein